MSPVRWIRTSFVERTPGPGRHSHAASGCLAPCGMAYWFTRSDSEMAFALEALPDFAIAMDAFLFGARRAMEIHRPACSSVSRDEAVMVALCGLAQADHDGPLLASLDILMAPTASRVAAIRLKAFAVALAAAGLRIAPAAGAAAGRLN